MQDLPPDARAFDLMGASLEPVAPPAAVRSRLMAALEGPARYLPFSAELSRHFDLPEPRLRELLSSIDAPGRWKRGNLPLEGYLDFEPGPALRPLHAGFVRLLGGAGFPLHRHRERELSFVLSGRVHDDAGRSYDAGSLIEMPPGSVHALSVTEGAPALLAVLNGGIEMLG
jgi:hypothetical protein